MSDYYDLEEELMEQASEMFWREEEEYWKEREEWLDQIDAKTCSLGI